MVGLEWNELKLLRKSGNNCFGQSKVQNILSYYELILVIEIDSKEKIFVRTLVKTELERKEAHKSCWKEIMVERNSYVPESGFEISRTFLQIIKTVVRQA